MSCSMNKVKSHILFTYKKCMFSDFTRKKMFCSKMVGEWGGGRGWGGDGTGGPHVPSFHTSRTFIFQRGILVGLFSVSLIFERLNF